MKTTITTQRALESFLWSRDRKECHLKDFVSVGDEVRVNAGLRSTRWNVAKITKITKHQVTTASERGTVYKFSLDSSGFLYEAGRRTDTYAARLSFDCVDCDAQNKRADDLRANRNEGNHAYGQLQNEMMVLRGTTDPEQIAKLQAALAILKA